MGQQAVNAIGGDGQLGIVVVIGVNADPIREGGKSRRNLAARADYRRSTRHEPEFIEMAADEIAALRARA